MKKSYRFSFDVHQHGDVINAIESIPKTLRTQYIVDVIRFTLSRVAEIPVTNLANDIKNPVTDETDDFFQKEFEKFKSKIGNVEVKEIKELNVNEKNFISSQKVNDRNFVNRVDEQEKKQEKKQLVNEQEDKKQVENEKKVNLFKIFGR